MNKQICIIIFLLACRICNAQNLVPNGDFEQYISCPTDFSQLDSAMYWFNPSTTSTPDYFNQCSLSSLSSVPINYFGFQQARSGVGYSGIGLFVQPPFNIGYREYLEVPLISPLVANSTYHFEMYINLGNICKFNTDDVGVYFSDTIILTSSWLNLPNIPQISNAIGNMPDTINWTLVSGNYSALGGESYIVIGNFKNDSNTTFTYVNNSGESGAYIYVDDVSLSLSTSIDEQYNNFVVNLFPNPFTDKLTITTKTNEQFEVTLYDITSRKILNQSFINSTSINTEQLAKGIYLYEVRNKNGVIKNGKVVKD